MKNKTNRRVGFRLSYFDAVILASSSAFALWLYASGFMLWWLVPVVLGHFFLFCNVFLVVRRLELLWAAAFVVNVGCHIAQGYLNGLSPLLWQLPVSLFVIGLQLRSPWYHGIAAKSINPRLDDYLNGNL